jgi:hypothetical protein
MTDVSTRRVTKSWFEVVAPNPTVRSELYLALRFAEQEYERVHGREADSDDAFEVYADDEEIAIRFEIKQGVQP